MKKQNLLHKLVNVFPEHKINFDFDECDRILIVHFKNVSAENLKVL